MKFFVLFAALFVFFACTSSKNITQINQSSKKQIFTAERVTGIVHLDENCGATITTKVGSKEMNLIPNNLDEKFKKEGMKLKFFFVNYSMSVSKGCKAELRGDLKDVNAIR
jgi:hypothetical protein